MDAPLVMRVAVTLDAALKDALLSGIETVGESGYRLVFERGERRTAVTVSLRPHGPWCGIAPHGVRHERKPADAFAAAAARPLAGSRLEAVRQPSFDRVIEFVFAGGPALVAELAGAGANLVALDRGGRVLAVARRSKASRRRLVEGEAYRPRPLPAGLAAPTALTAAQIDETIAEGRQSGRETRDVLRFCLFGLGDEAARLVVEESARTGASPGELLCARLRELCAGRLDPVVLAEGDPRSAAEQGSWDPGRFRLLPWPPDGVAADACLRGRDAAETVGLYFSAADTAALIERRLRGLAGIVQRESRRTREARDKARRDLEGFGDPERLRLWGEALLAGMHAARRVGDHALVADPYDPAARPISVPAPAAVPLTAAADAHFRSHRRARRGLEAARRRIEQLDERERRLRALAVCAESCRGLEGIRRLESEMRAAGLAVEVGASSRARRDVLPAARPRLEGVRMFTSSDGWTILVGRGGRENQRLTFKLAGPDDFWLHAHGRPGAHVVLRNPERRSEPPERSLREAAALAAHFSDARDERLAEVQWTRRKMVRKARNSPPGTVLVKRFKTVAVRPGVPLTCRFD